MLAVKLTKAELLVFQIVKDVFGGVPSGQCRCFAQYRAQVGDSVRIFDFAFPFLKFAIEVNAAGLVYPPIIRYEQGGWTVLHLVEDHVLAQTPSFCRELREEIRSHLVLGTFDDFVGEWMSVTV